MKEIIYSVKGMHCASCEILIEKKVLELKGVKSVEAKTGKGEILIEYEKEKPNISQLNEMFKKENYVFSDKKEYDKKPNIKEINISIIIASVFIIGFLFINKLGIAGVADVSSKSSLPTFFILGVLAGISSCAALVGGLVLSISKQWLETYSKEAPLSKKIQPHLMFNSGRIISYGVFGILLGIVGSKIQISSQFSSFLIFIVAVFRILMAFQMFGFKYFQKFQFTLPRRFTRYVSDEKNFKGRYMPFIMGAMTLFLPCGFTITAQGMALLSSNAIQGGLIMALFALGTAPGLLLIGLSSIKMFEKPHLALRFSRIAGILILFFALFNLNNQLSVLGFSNLNDAISGFSNIKNETDLPPMVNGVQVIKMDASASGYSPTYFKVRVGVPVRWEITDTGTSGCTNAIISAGLFNDKISLTHGQTAVKEFTPQKAGKYKFSCWMGMVSGTIEVVDPNISNSSSDQALAIPSGASGCGCSKQ